MLSEDDAPVAGLGVNAAAAPAGSPLALRPRGPVTPPGRVPATLWGAAWPWVTAAEAGVAESGKSGTPPQLGNLNEPMRVLQLNVPLFLRYSVVNQNVQSSTGSTVIAE